MNTRRTGRCCEVVEAKFTTEFSCNEYTVHCFRRRRMEWTEYTRCNRLRRYCVMACTVYFSLNKSTGCTHMATAVPTPYRFARTAANRNQPILSAVRIGRRINISGFFPITRTTFIGRSIVGHRSNRPNSRKTMCCDLITKSQYSEPCNHIIRGRF